MTDDESEQFPDIVATATDRAYRETAFVAETPAGEIPIRVGARHPSLDRLLQAAGVQDWAFITASNPHPQRLPDAENAARNEALRAGLRAAGFRCLPGRGVGSDSTWWEESVLVLGIDRAEAMAVGRKYAQAAIVVGRVGKPANLQYC